MLRRVLGRTETQIGNSFRRLVHKFPPADTSPLDTTFLPGPGKVFLPYQTPTPQTWVHNSNFEKIKLMELNGDVFDAPIRKDIVHRVVRWEQARAKRETHFVPTRGELGRTTAKIYRQKGMGRARHGDRYANIFKGSGGKSFGPRGPRDRSYGLQKKVVNFGMRCALTAKFKEGNLFVLDHTMLESHKTKQFVEHFEKWGVHRPVLLYSEGELDSNFILGARNLPWFDLYPEDQAPVYEVIRHHEVIITESALETLQTRLTQSSKPMTLVCPPLEELIALGEISVVGQSLRATE